MKRVTRDSGDKLFELTDKIAEKYLRAIVRLFGRLRRELNARNSGGTITAFDSLNALERVTSCYEQAKVLCRRALAEIARATYKRVNGSDDGFLVEMWLEERLARQDPVTHYVFDKELDNKRLRLFEAVVTACSEANPSDAVKRAVDTALKYLSKQFRQYGDDVTLETLQRVYSDNSVQTVEWVTQQDEKVCPECRALDGVRFPIDRIPAPRHYNCRCFWIPVRMNTESKRAK